MPSNDDPSRPAASAAGTAPDAVPAAPSRVPQRRTRRRWLLALVLAGVASLPLYPPAWHGVVRALLTAQAARQGCDLHIGRIDGGLFDTTLLYDVHCRQRAAPTGLPAGGTDLRVTRAEVTFAWRVPFYQGPSPGWVSNLVLEGISGQLDLSARGPSRPPPSTGAEQLRTAGFYPENLLASPWNLLSRQLAPFLHETTPARFRMASDDLVIRRGRFWLRWSGGRLTGAPDEPGQFTAREVGIGGPGYENTFADRHAQTYWKDGRLTFANLELRPTVVLRSVVLDGGRLDRRRLDWESELVALGGTVRGQGSLDFSRRRLGLEIACSLAGVQVRPLAKTLGVAGVTGGQVVQGNFTFRGDLEDPLAAEMWMTGSVTDFRWGQRRWESLNARAIVINRHLQVRELELRQSRNRLSFNGECALPPAPKPVAPDPAPPEDWWRQTAFSCNIDARLDDLQALSNLLSPELPELAGRMSVNGTITARNGEVHGFDGYLNVEGSALSIRRAPLDYLRSTLLFHGDEVRVADLQATHGGDYLTGKGVLKILGPFHYQAELRASARDLAVYAPAYVGVLSPQPVSGALNLEWSGEGTAAAHGGSFRGAMEQFFTSAGGVMPRPVNLAARGSYSPESVSVRRLTLADGEGKERHDAIKVEGTIPWNEDPQQWQSGHWMDLTRPMTVRAQCTDAPLDVLAALVPGVIHAARGRISGTLEANDAWRAPLLNGTLQLRDADLVWTESSRVPVESVSAAVHIEQSVLRVDDCHGLRGGDAFALHGTVDLHDTADPDLDLAIAGQRAVRSDDGRFKALANYALTVHRTRQAGTHVSGDIELSDGYVRRRVEFDPRPFLDPVEVSPAGLLNAFAQALPREWLDAQLDLHLTTPGSLTVDEITAQGELFADLLIGGTWREPRFAGSLIMRGGKGFLPERELDLIEGGLYFAAPLSEAASMSVQPGLSLIADRPGAGAACFFGRIEEGMPANWPLMGPLKPGFLSPAAPEMTLLTATEPECAKIVPWLPADQTYTAFTASQSLGADRLHLHLR